MSQGQFAPRWVFQPGDQALLIDRKGRRHMLTLEPGKAFHSNAGLFPHDGLIGQDSGCRIQIGSQKMLALKPTLAEYVQEMPRVTQVIYPKDIGPILTYADVFPGARVLEAGMGSGSLTLALVGAIGPQGRLFCYDLHQETIDKALRNLRRRSPVPDNLTAQRGDVYQAITEKELDRIILDVPEPWNVVPHAANALVPGGILLCWLPTVLQIHRLAKAFAQQPEFDLVDSFEVILRPWHLTGQSARPVHRMIAHTGFITTARKCAPGKFLRPDQWSFDLEPTAAAERPSEA
ncbi:MAG: tRNA (adenine-N1)-methyltransferase [Dehalococcoidia bacterium]|nr:tRNA (adenine-N1)-methyltransferase [Dehalococcoidia bacterium]